MNLLNSLIPADFRRAIDAPLRRFFFGIFVARFATGLTLSLYVVYLHNVLHFSISFSTLLLAVSSLAGLLTSPLWGTLTDRVGPVKVLVFGAVTDAAALVYWAFIHSERAAIVGGLALTVLGGTGWGPGSTLLVRLVAREHRQRAYAFNFMLVNLGIGCGALVSAAVVDLHHPRSFRWLYLGNAGVSLAAGAVFITLWKFGHRAAQESDGDEPRPSRARDGWSTVVRDRRLVLFVTASLTLMLGGYGSLDAGLSLFAVNNLHLSVHVIGIFLFVNTGVIVLSQLVVVNLINARSRTRVLACVGAMWFFFWLVVSISLSLPRLIVVLAISLGMVVFALGETMLSPVGPAIINEIAPEHLRGRYNAAQGLSWSLSATIAPAIAAGFFDSGLSNWWPLGVGVMALAGSVLMLNLRRHLTASEDGRVPALPGDAQSGSN